MRRVVPRECALQTQHMYSPESNMDRPYSARLLCNAHNQQVLVRVSQTQTRLVGNCALVKMPRRKHSAAKEDIIGLDLCPYCSGHGDCPSREEVIALTDEKVLPGPSYMNEYDELQFRVDQFVIHSRHDWCSLDDGLVEKGTKVYVCGLLSALIHNEHSGLTGGVPVKLIGPIQEWWFSGFDGGQNLLLGIESPFSSYLLQEPHSIYSDTFRQLNTRMYITKCVIECLSEQPHSCDFDQLVAIMRQRMSDFDYEHFLCSIPFVVRQIRNYDLFCEPGETRLTETAIFATLLKLSGASALTHNSNRFHRVSKCFDRKKKSQFGKHVNTPLSEQIFASIYQDMVTYSEKNYLNEKSLKSPHNEDAIGKFVCIELKGSTRYGRIIDKLDNGRLHINFLCLGNETLLGETSPKQCLMLTTECDQVECNSSLMSFIDVQLGHIRSSTKTSFSCFFIYDQKLCSFEALPLNYEQNCLCLGCITKRNETPSLVTSDEVSLSEVHYRKMKIQVGDCVAFEANASLILQDYFSSLTEVDVGAMDELIYPEKYRKSLSSNKDSYQTSDLLQCCQIGHVRRIESTTDAILLHANLFYRPHNIKTSFVDFIKSDLNVLYWTDIVTVIDVRNLRSRCQVFYGTTFECDVYRKPDVFCFEQCYDPTNGRVYEPSSELKSTFAAKGPLVQKTHDDTKLRILDLFSGCGGLSYGFEPLALHIQAIENDKVAATSFQKNFKNASVLNTEANILLDQLLNATDEFVKQSLPDKNSFDIILGGPPCQGFSEMNRFSSSEYSHFKNSLVATYLNYIEYYRPKYFVLENVRNLVFYKNSLLLKIICSFFVRLGYQIRVAILQAGLYGVPQNRRRLFIIGAAASCTLPSFPQVTHAFAAKKSDTSFKIDGKKYDPFEKKLALYRMMTVEDAIGDLPALSLSEYCTPLIRKYEATKGLLYYQRMMRFKCDETLCDHCCREISKLNQARITQISRFLGSDWRDLPNIEIKLADGSTINKLEYRFVDARNGNGPNGARRGVCGCAEGRGGECGSSSRQVNTLIPWCLVHTANRHNHWPGVFGRLSGKGFFPTTTTNPDPMSVQGRVLHPHQDRILSVREMARSQTFPDHFVFFGSIDDKYRQIGNAVPPTLSIAIARQFMTSIQSSDYD